MPRLKSNPAREHARKMIPEICSCPGNASESFAPTTVPEIAAKNEQQMAAYREMPDAELFDHQWVRVSIGAEEMPGFKGPRVACEECGEGINFQREVVKDGRTLCKSCAGERYYQPL